MALSRVADKVALVLDDGQRVERSVARNTGEKISVLDVAGTIRLPDAPSPLDRALAAYARLFLQAERMWEEGTSPSPAEARALDDAATALDRVRPHGTEDLRIVLDRSADPTRYVEQGAALRQAWADEGRTRTDPGAYSDRFVADWQAASQDRGTAETWRVHDRVERRMERLEDRMLRQPKLEKALDAHLPELQRRIEDMPMSGAQRERDFDMGM